MRENLSDPQVLTDHAHAGLLSPFHFHRVFREVTLATPARFLTALRMSEAQRLLIHSGLRVSDICASVGYLSSGTFTTQFTRLVGVSPREFRLVVQRHGDRSLVDCVPGLPDPHGPAGDHAEAAPGGLDGVVESAADGILFVGAFTNGIPQGTPLTCTVTAGPGPVRLPPAPDGDHHVLCVQFTSGVTLAESLDPRRSCRLVGSTPGTVRVRCGRAAPFRIVLREPRPTDPPVVLALPVPARRPAARRRAASAPAVPAARQPAG
ncbi:helix-turn-helix transcriptional regulator [Saccharothrix stipae]